VAVSGADTGDDIFVADRVSISKWHCDNFALFVIIMYCIIAVGDI